MIILKILLFVAFYFALGLVVALVLDKSGIDKDYKGNKLNYYQLVLYWPVFIIGLIVGYIERR